MNTILCFRLVTCAAWVAVIVPTANRHCLAQKQRSLKVEEGQLLKLSEALPEKAKAMPAKPRKILIYWGCWGACHGAIPLANTAMEDMGERTGAYTSEVTNDPAVFTPEKLAAFDVILLNNSTRMQVDEAQRAAIMEFVKSGKGIIGIHAATDNFYDWPEAAEMMGGLFRGHPWKSDGTWAVKIDEPQHPLCKAFDGKGFLVKEEIYRFRNHDSRSQHTPRETLRLLVSLDMTKQRNQLEKVPDENAIAWIRQWGKGRVFYCSLGHNAEVFFDRRILQFYLDGIQYALGDLEADATPSAQLAEKPTPALCPDP